MNSSPRSILLVRTSALGDVVHALPVLNALRHAHPEAHLAWVVEDLFAPLIRDQPALDEVIPVRLRAWRRRPWGRANRQEVGNAVRALRGCRPEVAVDLMGNHKGGLLARVSGARRRVGAARTHRREPASRIWINAPVAVRGDHAVDRGLDLLSELIPEIGEADFGGDHILPRAPAEAQDWLAAHPQPYVLIQPGAGWGNKQYPVDRWGRIARALADDGLAVWVLAGPGEQALAAAVAAHSDGAASALPAAGLDLLAALLRHCRLLLGGDTGPLHLAHALGTPVLSLMGPTDPARHGPYSAPERALFRTLPCSFCSKRFGEAKACLLSLPVEAVVAAAREALEP